MANNLFVSTPPSINLIFSAEVFMEGFRGRGGFNLGLGELTFVGLGLFDELDISLKGVEAARRADVVYAELYTSLMRGLSLENLQNLIGKEVHVVGRRLIEEEGSELILERAEESRVVLLVPGDPLIATTHIDLRLRAERRGIKTRVIHAASILSAAIGLSGLQNYRFGKNVTVPFPEPSLVYETPYMVIYENKVRDLHTLCFLDIRVEESKFMTVKEGLRALFEVEKRKRLRAVTSRSLAVGVARAGSDDAVVKADYVERLMEYNFGPPPHTLIFPAGRLHFVEAEALITLAGAPEDIRGMIT